MSAWFEDSTVTLHHGDALAVAKGLPAGSVDCIVTSPPYFSLRDYGEAGQYGSEGTPEEFVDTLAGLFDELSRVLADDGTAWVNLGDTYGKDKSLIGVPWMVALELRRRGWILRNEVIWAKPNGMPSSARDRLANKHEHLFLFTKGPGYWFDLDPIREQYTGDRSPSRRARSGHVNKENSATGKWSGDHKGRNPGDVWNISTVPFPGAHFAVFPPELARRCVVAGCKPGGTVLDPFSGSGTTGKVALENGRKYVGIDLNADYLQLSLDSRLRDAALPLEGMGV